jgi:hypothetical protein
MSLLEASNSMVNGSLKFGIASVGVVVMTVLSSLKALSAASGQPNLPFLRRLVRGRAIRL